MSVANDKKWDIPDVERPRLKPIQSCLLRNNLSPEEESEQEYVSDRNRHKCESLNPEQREIYDYALNNLNDIIVIQAGPGTGKTHTLKTIAYNCKNPVNVIIYKHDLLYDFRFVAVRYTVAKFFMNLFNLSYDDYKRLTNDLNGHFNSAQFLLAIVNVLSKVNVPNFEGCLVILDEYTVIPKPLLLILLMLLKYYKIGTILCGNKYQLQNIPNSEHIGNCSSFDMATCFADKIFYLKKNVRCSNVGYNEILEYVSSLSSCEWIDDFAKCIIVACFHKQVLFGSTKFTDTHMAGSHQELTHMAEELVLKEKHKVSYYKINNKEISSPFKSRFLRYLPLVIGSMYYVDDQSELNKGELVSIGDDVVEMQLKNGLLVTKFRKVQDNWFSVIFNEHREFLEDGNSDAEICNYPIYPANFFTIHKSQGRMIEGPLDLNLESTTYQGLCVAISRVQDPSQIVRVSISDPLPHLVSCIVNFEELVDPNFIITAKLLQSRMINYKLYQPFPSMLEKLDMLVQSFFQMADIKNRIHIRNLLMEKISSLTPRLLNPPLSMDEQEDWKNTTVCNILKNNDLFLGLTCLKVEDRGVWLQEFIKRTPGIKLHNQANPDRIAFCFNQFYVWSGLQYMPDSKDNMMSFIEKLSNPGDFGKEIYEKYSNGKESEITSSWLVNFLNKYIIEWNKKVDNKRGRKRSHLEAIGSQNSIYEEI